MRGNVAPLMYEPCNCSYCVSNRAKAAVTEKPDNSEINAEIDRIIKQIHASGTAIATDRLLLRKTASELMKAVTKGYKKDFIEVAFGSPDFEMLKRLTTDTFHFSAAKNYQELKDFSSAMVDNGRVLSFNEFKEATDAINNKYNLSWLETEYNQAIATSQMSARWVEFEQNNDYMLRYQTVGDANVRDSHARLNNITKPVSSSFWDVNYPPNGWGCRCDVVQLATKKGKETDLSGKQLPVIPDMWAINVGKQSVVFPPGHAYYKNIPTDAWTVLDKATKTAVVKNITIKATYLTDKKVFRDELNSEILFTKKNIKEYVNQPHKHFMEKNFAIYKMDEILKEASYKGVLKKRKETDDYISHLFVYDKTDKIKLNLVVKTMNNGKTFFYSVSDNDDIGKFLE